MSNQPYSSPTLSMLLPTLHLFLWLPEPMVCAFFPSLDMVRRMSRRLQHPLHSLILEDPITRSRLPLGLVFLRLDREFTNKLVVKFTEVKASQNKKAMLDSDVNDLIYEETNHWPRSHPSCPTLSNFNIIHTPSYFLRIYIFAFPPI